MGCLLRLGREKLGRDFSENHFGLMFTIEKNGRKQVEF